MSSSSQGREEAKSICGPHPESTSPNVTKKPSDGGDGLEVEQQGDGQSLGYNTSIPEPIAAASSNQEKKDDEMSYA